jgi:hypothetical protein
MAVSAKDFIMIRDVGNDIESIVYPTALFAIRT